MHLCPRCGEFAQILLPNSGWCIPCNSELGIRVCERCEGIFKSKTNRPRCSSCREEVWLEEHADEIEQLMIEGCSFSAARKKVQHSNRPHCMGCNILLPKFGYFCTTNKKCRSLYVKYKNLKTRKGLSTQEALRETLKNGNK